jgi:ribosomal protein S24E
VGKEILQLRQDKMVKVIEEKQNPLFKRKEVSLEVTQETVPSNDEARKIVCSEFKCDNSLVRIRKIDSKFGSSCFNVIADIYDSKEEFDRIVKKTKQEVEAEKKAEEEKLAKEAEEKAAAEAAKTEAEKPVEEAPAEESTEEKVEEAKE